MNVELAAAPVVQTWTAPLSSTYVGLMGLISVIVGALFWWRAIKRPALLRVQTADEVQTASGAPLVGLLSTGRPPSPTWGRASRAALGISHAALAAGLLLALLLVASGDDYARLLASDPYTALSGSLWRVFGGAG